MSNEANLTPSASRTQDEPGSGDADARVAAAVARAREAQRSWGRLTPRERARRLRALRALLVERADEIVATVREETGKPATEALAHEVFLLANLVRGYERSAPPVLRSRRVGSWPFVHKRARKVYEPYGVIGVIGTWNFPFSLPGLPVVSALFAGNAVVLKPSEVAPACGRLLAALVEEAIPDHPGLVQVVEGRGEMGAALARSAVDKLVFIGSPGTGRKVLAAAAERLTPVLMELGSNDVAIVCDDADVERAAAGIVWGAVANAGQICVSVERALVADAVHDRFVAAVEREMRAVRPGVEMGRMILPGQLDRLREVVADARACGARIPLGGDLIEEGGDTFAPTLILDASEEMEVSRGESFGPVLSVYRVRDDREAIRLANASPFGLVANVWTGSRRRARELSARLDAGTVVINDALVSFGFAQLPYGGVKESGFGRLLGDEGLLEFARVKGVVESRAELPREPFWYPYTDRRSRVVRALGALYAPGLEARWRTLRWALGKRSDSGSAE
jgi:acyl-CoA reductase-like NAD-dependent aldehyde dehydrogenase